MLEHIAYPDIDKTAYDGCVIASDDFRVYALSGYLDAVAGEWDLLVLDDYRAVMPLPKRTKYGLPYVYTPPFVQQLGVFSSRGLSGKQEAEFYRAASSRYFLMDYFAHSGSSFRSGKRKERVNYTLQLDSAYEDLLKGFNKNRKRIIGKGFEGLRLERQGDPEVFLKGVQEEETGFRPEGTILRTLGRLLTSGIEGLHVSNVLYQDNWVGGLLWLRDPKRITYLFPVLTDDGRKLQAGTFVLDSLIREYQETGLLLDLEGSMIPGVADFYRSFGAKREIYYYFKSRLYGLF